MKYLFTLLSLLAITTAKAQNQQTTVLGSVTSKGNPVPFADVYIKNGTIGTSADADGNYRLEIQKGKITFVAQSQGYKTQTKILDLIEDTEITVNFNRTVIE